MNQGMRWLLITCSNHYILSVRYTAMVVYRWLYIVSEIIFIEYYLIKKLLTLHTSDDYL